MFLLIENQAVDVDVSQYMNTDVHSAIWHELYMPNGWIEFHDPLINKAESIGLGWEKSTMRVTRKWAPNIYFNGPRPLATLGAV